MPKIRKPRPSTSQRTKLRTEPLEDRRVLAGVVPSVPLLHNTVDAAANDEIAVTYSVETDSVQLFAGTSVGVETAVELGRDHRPAHIPTNTEIPQTVAQEGLQTPAFEPDDDGSQQIVIGGDDRFQPTNTFSQIGRLWTLWPDGTETMGTGTMFSQRHVLTAGQQVYNASFGGWASQIYFSPGQSGDAIYDPIFDTSFRRSDGQTYGEARGTNFTTFNGWINNTDPEFNMGFVQLDRNIGNLVGWSGYGFNDDSSFFTTPTFGGWYSAGYANDFGGLEQYETLGGSMDAATTNVLYSDSVDLDGGQIGSATAQWSSGIAGIIHDSISYGVYGAERPSVPDNGFVRITGPRFDVMQNMVSGDGPATDLADLVDFDDWFDADFAFMSSSTVSSGDSFSVTAYPRNNGTATAGTYSVSFYASTNDFISTFDTLLGSTTVSGTAPLDFSTAQLSTTFPALAAGDYYVGWIIDSGNSVGEYQENDNTGLISGQLLTVQAAINEDVFEQNDTPSTAADLSFGDQTHFDLNIDQQSDDDYYAWTASASGDLAVDVAFLHSNGDVDLEVFDASQNLLAFSNSVSNAEQVNVAVSAGDEYIIRVYGFNGATNPNYTLTLDGPESTNFDPVADFDQDGDNDCQDVDLLVANIAGASNDLDFDIDGSGFVDTNDLDFWLVVAGNAVQGASYLPGDANLDGNVDGADFLIWNTNKFTSNAAWCAADFNADGNVNGGDFLIWNTNKFQSSDLPRAANTPVEPTAGGIPVILATTEQTSVAPESTNLVPQYHRWHELLPTDRRRYEVIDSIDSVWGHADPLDELNLSFKL